MKRRYAVHPMEFAIGETEQFYSDMAARGWLLEKRGAWLSRFRRGEPAAMRYRVELSDTRFLDPDPDMPEEQIAVYEDCGWTLVTHRGIFYVFSAPADSDAPEFYSDPRQQAQAVKGLRRSYLLAWVFLLLVTLIYTGLYLSMGSRSLESWAGAWLYAAISDTGLVLLLAGMLFWGLFSLFYGSISVGRLYRRLKKGIPMDHAPGRRYSLYKAVRLLSGCLMAFAVAVMGVQYLGARNSDVPEVSDGPYLTLEELNVSGERQDLFGKPASLRHETGLLAENWDVFEDLYDADQQSDCWLYQDIWKLRFPQMADAFVESLMWDSIFNSGPADFRSHSDPRFDGVWTGRNELYVVRGDTVWKFTYYELDDQLRLENLLAGVAERAE